MEVEKQKYYHLYTRLENFEHLWQIHFCCPSWIQCQQMQQKDQPFSPLAFSSFWYPTVSVLNLLKLLEKKPSSAFWYPCSPGEPGREGSNTATAASQEGERGPSEMVPAGKLLITIVFDSSVSYRSGWYWRCSQRTRNKMEKVRVSQHHCSQIHPEALSHYNIKTFASSSSLFVTIQRRAGIGLAQSSESYCVNHSSN